MVLKENPIITRQEQIKFSLIGLGALILGILFLVISLSLHSNEQGDSFWYLFGTHIGITLLEFVLVILFFEIILRSDSITKIKGIFDHQIKSIEEQNEKLNEKTAENFSILQVAKDSKIDKLYSDRERIRPDIIKILNLDHFTNLAKKNNQKEIQIDMLGICLRDFFCDNGIFKETIDKFFNSLLQCPDSKEVIEKVTIRIMILYPYSNIAIIRIIREFFTTKAPTKSSVSYPEKEIKDLISNIKELRLYREGSESLNYLAAMEKKFKENQRKNLIVEFSVKICTLNPMNYILRFNEKLFMEPYHFGFDTCKNEIISGKVVIVAFKKGKVHDLFKDHFDFLWKDKTSLDVKDVCTKEFLGFRYLTPDELQKNNLNKKMEIQQNLTTYEYYKI